MLEIIKTALKFLAKSKGWFYVFPGFVAVVMFLLTLFVDNTLDLLVDVVGPIGIFSALMFSVIFIVVEHFLKRKEKFATENEEDIDYLQRYHDFTRDTVAVISFSIFLAGFIILLVIVAQHIHCDLKWYLASKNLVFSYFILQYFAIIIIVVKQMYAMLIDDMEKK